MNWRELLIVIGIIWLALIFFILISQGCYTLCIGEKPNMKCGCELNNYPLQFLIYGLPSWILFLIAALIKSKSKSGKIKENRRLSFK